MQFASLIHELVKNHCLIPLLRTTFDVGKFIYFKIKTNKGNKK